MNFIAELKRRNVIRMAGLYLVPVAFVGGPLGATHNSCRQQPSRQQAGSYDVFEELDIESAQQGRLKRMLNNTFYRHKLIFQ